MYQPFTAPIVVGADGSPSSVNAVRTAARYAALYGRPLRIVHAFNWLPTMSAHGGTQNRRFADEVVDHALRIARAIGPDLTISTRVLEGRSTTILLRESRTAGLLVIGDGGLGDRSCPDDDSGALQVAARASCSVLVTRAVPAAGGLVVAGVDRSAAAAQVLDFAFTFAARSRQSLLVVQAVERPQGLTARGVHHVSGLIDEVEHRSRSCAVEATARVRRGEPADVLRSEAADADLLIVGPRGERLGRGLLGPVAQELLHNASAPLIIVRHPMPRAAVGSEVPAADAPLLTDH